MGMGAGGVGAEGTVAVLDRGCGDIVASGGRTRIAAGRTARGSPAATRILRRIHGNMQIQPLTAVYAQRWTSV